MTDKTLDSSDHISRFVSDDGYALSFVSCQKAAQLIGQDQHHLTGDALEFASKGMIASLLMATRLKGKGMLSINITSDIGRIRECRIDAMGMGYIRGLVRHVESGEDLLGSGTLHVRRQLEHNKQSYQSSIPINSDRFIHVCNAYLHSSEQVQALICHDVRIDGDQVTRARGFYLERLPAADKHPESILNDRYDDLYEAKQDYHELPDYENDEHLIADIFGNDQFKKLRQYDVEFYCPCSKERYMDTLRGFSKQELEGLVNDEGHIPTICDFCHSSYAIELEELL